MRTEINTVFTPRVKPSTTYTVPRDTNTEPFTFDSNDFTFDNDLFTWDMTLVTPWPIITSYSTPRYGSYIEDLLSHNISDLLEEQVQWLSGNRTNKIDTFWN